MSTQKRKRVTTSASVGGRKKYKAQPMVSSAKRGPTAELKFVDFELVDLTAGATAGELVSNGTTNNFLLIPEGNGPNARNGRKISVRSIHSRWNISQNNATTPIPTNFFRIVFAVDTQCNGADPSPNATNTGVFTNMAAATTDAQGFFNLLNGKRFKILYDKFYATGHTGAGLAATDTFAGRGFRGKFNHVFKKPLEIEYDSSVTTGATGSIRTNNLFAMFFAGAADVHSITMVTRVRYTDY